MTMPIQKPGRSKQDYCTPQPLLTAVKTRLVIKDFNLDIAATHENTVAPLYWSLEEGYDALDPSIRWGMGGWSWLNPPFGHILPWVKKAKDEALKGAQIAMLVPASVGANWWAHYVEPYAYQSYLNGRVTFVGETTPYPKDCAILLFTPWGMTGHEIWYWRNYESE